LGLIFFPSRQWDAEWKLEERRYFIIGGSHMNRMAAHMQLNATNLAVSGFAANPRAFANI
jgi:hypothetical protein